MRKIWAFLRKTFVTGMIVIIPLWITILAVRAFIGWIHGAFSLLPAALRPGTYIPIYGIEIIIALVIIVLIGLLAGNFIGKKFLSIGEIILSKIPVIKTVYQGVKHLTTGIMSDKKIFSRVVLLKFPFGGLTSIGFVTGEASDIMDRAEGKKLLKIFIPTTPNPTSGFFCIVAEDEVENLNMSVDDAFKLIISAGYADMELS